MVFICIFLKTTIHNNRTTPQFLKNTQNKYLKHTQTFDKNGKIVIKEIKTVSFTPNQFLYCQRSSDTKNENTNVDWRSKVKAPPKD